MPSPVPEITKTAATVAFYRKEGRRLIMQAGTSKVSDDSQMIMDTVQWFAAQHHRWKPASIRIFRAALRQLMHDLRQNIHINQRGIADFETALQSGPAPKPRSAEKVGASKKRKSVKKSEIKRLYAYLQHKGTQTSRVLAKWLMFGVYFGWRPSEALRGMSLDDGNLLIKCAKTTNGRGIGETRVIEINNHGVEIGVAAFIKSVDKLASSVNATSIIHERLSKALTAACDACKVRRISLYTLRHQALATAKAMMTPEEVAALAGHASVNTAAAHYGRRRSGWDVKFAVAVPAAQVALVRGEFREFRRGTVLTPAP